MSARGWKALVAVMALMILGYGFVPGDPWWETGWQLISGYVLLLIALRLVHLQREVGRQRDRLRELSRHDELTGLPNEKAWKDELPHALERARRDDGAVSVAVLDLDHFTIFNDCYGRAAADGLLVTAGEVWDNELRAVDLLARQYEDRFFVLLPGAAVDVATVALQRLQSFTPLGQHFSAGVATWDGTETSDHLISRADAALHAAKAAGRNRVVQAEAVAPVPPAAVDTAVTLGGTNTVPAPTPLALPALAPSCPPLAPSCPPLARLVAAAVAQVVRP